MEGGFGRWEELRGKYLSFYFIFFLSGVFFGENTYTYVVSIPQDPNQSFTFH